MNTPKQLRQQLRQQRLRLSKHQRQRAAHQAIRQLAHLQHPSLIGQPINIGLFVAAFGEIPTQPLLHWARRRGYNIYLPVVTGKNRPLVFAKFCQHTWLQSRMPRHPLGMRQPEQGKTIAVSELDILFMPLVAADKKGNRMGMGGGYYDRTLAKTKTKPLKIGWAYDFQLVELLASHPWDVRLDILITPSKLWWFKRYLTKRATMKPTYQDDRTSFETLMTSIIEDDKSITNMFELPETRLELTEIEIASVMNPNRLAQLLHQADAFTLVNSEDLDDF